MTDSPQQPWTVLRLLEWTTRFFKQRQSPSPRLDAEVLLAHARRCERIDLYTTFNDVPNEDQRAEFRELVRRRGEGTPVAYLVGYREFYSLKFRVDPRVLIPRPETEHLVVAALDHLRAADPDDGSIAVADVGTGSGAIAISIAKHCAAARIYAIDISPSALELAAKNAELHGVQARIEWLHGNLLGDLDPEVRFELICSNPPYVSESEYECLSSEVRDHEPRQALVGGTSGTEIVEQLIAQSDQRLERGGKLLIEISPMIADAAASIASRSGRWNEPELIKDLAGHCRVLSLTLK